MDIYTEISVSYKASICERINNIKLLLTDKQLRLIKDGFYKVVNFPNTKGAVKTVQRRTPSLI